jgi:hypothetical protein
MLLAAGLITSASCDTSPAGQALDASSEAGTRVGEDDERAGCFGIASGDADPHLDAADASSIDRDEDCDGADLYLELLRGCSACSGVTATVIIANRGTRPTSYHLESNAETLDIAAPLEPQTASEPHVLALRPPSSTIRVTATGAVDDCDVDNDVREIDVVFVTCE